MEIKFRKAVPFDACRLLDEIRDADLAEIMCSGLDPVHIVSESIVSSEESIAVECDGEFLALIGCGTSDGFGVPWMLGTKRLNGKGMSKAIHKYGRQYVDSWMKKHGRLFNAVHAKNKKAIRWLEGLGFNIDRSKPLDVRGHEFYGFSMGA